METFYRVHLTIRLSRAERYAINRAAVDLDVSVSALARRAFFDYLERLARDRVTHQEPGAIGR